MSAVAKKLHVHFDDDVLADSTSKVTLTDELTDRKNGTSKLNYTRDELLELAKAKWSKDPPKFPFDIKNADEKQKQKIKSVLKNVDILKCLYEKNSVQNFTAMSECGVGEKNSTHIVNERERTDFKQLIAAAVSNAQQPKIEYAGQENRRRRIGSGRIVDCTNYSNEPNAHNNNNNQWWLPMGMDARYMRNELFKESNDYKRSKNWKSGGSGGGGGDFNWNSLKMSSRLSSADSDNTDAKSDEPEWANVGVSKSDIIELHGFDGPSTSSDDDKLKSDNSSDNTSILLPARSTPSKPMPTKAGETGKLDDYFNFEDFLKLDLPASVNGAREHDNGESRFSQWFSQNGSPKHSADNQMKSSAAQQFFNYHQKTNLKKMTTMPNLANASFNKLRSVNELEADLCPNTQSTTNDATSQQDLNKFRFFLNQLNGATTNTTKQRNPINAAQANYLLNLINRNTENLYQHQWSQNIVMKRPDAQLILHRLVNGEITQWHLLQQLNNASVHHYDRETFAAVLNFCNEHQQWLHQQQQQHLKHKEFMSQQLRQLQMWQMKNTQMRPPTPQELQIHTQNIMQNAVFKKQFEEQCRKLQGNKSHYSSKYQSNKMNRYNQKKYNQIA